MKKGAASIVFLLVAMANGYAFENRSKDNPVNRCENIETSDLDEVAEAAGITKELLTKVMAARVLKVEDICTMPDDKLKRAIHKTESPKPATGAAEWAAQRAMQEASENGKVRPNGMLQAMEQRRAILDVKQPAAGISPATWTFIGPGNIGGRVRAIAIHPTNPNKMWAGSVSGGIWATQDGGASWAPVNDFMGNLSISSIVIDKQNTNVMYAGTGEGFFNADAVRGLGLFKSTDGGVTWSQLPSTTPNPDPDADAYNWYYVNRITQSGASLLSANGGYYGNSGGIYRSTNGGSTWSKTYSGRVLDIKTNPENSNNIIATAIKYDFNVDKWVSNIITSNDNGQTWSVSYSIIDSGARIEIGFAASSGIAYAAIDRNGGELLKTTNAGASWSLISTPGHLGGQGWYDNTLWVDPSNSNNIIIGGIDLYRSTNGGSGFSKISEWYSWPTSAHADHHIIVNHPQYNGTSNRTVYFGNDGGIYKATDALGVQPLSGWINLNNGLGVTQFYGGAATPSLDKIIGGTQDNGHLMSTSIASTAWAQTQGGDGGFVAIDPVDSNYTYGEYVRLNLYRSSDGGYNYSEICGGILEANSNYCGGTGETLFIAPFELDKNNPSTMLAGAASLWRSTNVKSSSPTWSLIKSRIGSDSSQYISAIEIASGNSSIIWVGHVDGSVFSTNNGTSTNPTWTQRDNGASPLPNRYVTRILVDKDNHQIAYVAFGGYESDNLYKTTNGGISWVDVSGNLPSAPIRAIERHPFSPNWLYVGTEVGVFTSQDGGSSWSTTNDGPANVSVDELSWAGNRLLAATHGRGMFITDVSSAVSASCGTANNVASIATPTSLCSSGTPSSVTSSNTLYSWSCVGGTTVQCSAPRHYSLSGTLSAGGSVQITPNQASYAYNSNVTLAATPEAGKVFGAWGGDCTGTRTNCTLVMSANRSYNASFSVPTENHFSRMYLAAFLRAADQGGMNYWSNQINNEGQSYQRVGGTIFSLSVVTAIYPAGMTDQAFVEAIYNNVFGRASDAEGLNYWTNELITLRNTYAAQGSGNAAFEARGQLVVNMMNAGLGTAEGTPGKAYIDHRFQVALYASERQRVLAKEIPPATLRSISDSVTADPATIAPAKAAIDAALI